jgi:predicted phosphoribosyltransferase
VTLFNDRRVAALKDLSETANGIRGDDKTSIVVGLPDEPLTTGEPVAQTTSVVNVR